jgi:hypothetical protein
MRNDEGDGLPIEDFIQALTSQLDRAQATMAVKARFGLPLTFAVREISIDLRAHVSMTHNQVRIAPAGPGDPEASVIHLNLTTITRPMIEENTVKFEPEDVPLTSVLTDELDEDEQRRLEWAGIRTVSQLRNLQREGSEQMVGQVAQIPATRLRQALQRASMPFISRVTPGQDGRLSIRGLNLMNESEPLVHIGGERAAVLEAGERELIVMPLAYTMDSLVSVETAPGQVIEGVFSAQPPYPVTPEAIDDAEPALSTDAPDDPHSALHTHWQRGQRSGK